MNIFFQVMLNEVLKSSDVKQQEIKELVAVSYNFYKKHFQNLKENAKQVYIFIRFWLVFHLA